MTAAITLNGPLPTIVNSMTIDASETGIRVDATSGNAGSVFTIVQGVTVTIEGLTITGGHGAAFGGGINNSGNLSLIDDEISGNQASSRGGGIYNNSPGTLGLQDASIGSNTSGGDGGGIYNSGTLDSCNENEDGSSIYNNTAANDGGGIENLGGTIILYGDSIMGNTATSGDGGGVDNAASGSFTLYGGTISWQNYAGQ